MKSDNITIVMYHYTRDLKNSKYPEIKGLETHLFEEQLEYLDRHYNFISVNDLINNNELPENPVLLTFDDGYIDNYTVAYPLFKKRGIKGAFFPVVDSSKNGKVLDINKIHFILASVENKSILVSRINEFILENKTDYNLEDCEYYRNQLPKSRFDTEDVIYIKCMLQKDLPLELRNKLADKLFKEYVSLDEADFASTLYANSAQLSEMAENGMSIGIHSYSHSWLATLSKEQQEFEIFESIKYLKSIGVKDSELIISYPSGSYNDTTIEIVKSHDVKLGFTTKVEKADIKKRLELSRFDTNDFPKNKNAEYKG